MQHSLTVRSLFHCAGLKPSGPVPWNIAVEDRLPGVYVVALVGDADLPGAAIDITNLPQGEAARWIPGAPVVYIGRARRSLRRRISQFYRHEHGDPRPHRGGQAVLLLPEASRWVFWAPTEASVEAERIMIETFMAHAGGRLPFANRKKGDRPATS